MADASQPTGSDRRARERINVAVELKLEAPEQRMMMVSRTVDLSSHGAFVRTNRALPVGAQVQVAFTRGAAALGRVAAALGTVLVTVGVVLAFSRGALVGLGLAVVYAVCRGFVRVRHVVILGAVAMVLVTLVPQARARLETLGDVVGVMTGTHISGIQGADGSVQSRATEMLGAALVFAGNPWFGVGPGMFPHHYQEAAAGLAIRMKTGEREAHSLPLGLAADHGALGLICFAGAVLVTIVGLARAERRWRPVHPEFALCVAALEGAVIVYLTTGLFLHLSYARYFWFLLALGGAAIAMPLPKGRARRAATDSGASSPLASTV